MLKLSLLKDFFGVISSIHAAWPTLLLAAAAVLPSFVALPPFAFVGLGAFMVLALVFLVYKARHRFIYLPLDVAARRAYELLDGTVWTAAAERMHDKPSVENTLDYMGQLLINGNEGVALYGNKPPSTIFKQIDSKLLKRSAVKDHCIWLKSSDDKDLPWTNLQVERRAFKRRVKEMKANDWPSEEEEQPALMKVVVPPIEQQIKDLQPPAQERNTAREILEKMAAADGELIIVGALEGTSYQVGNYALNSSFQARELAMLRDAVDELEAKKLIRLKKQTENFVMFEVTGAGYKEAEA